MDSKSLKDLRPSFHFFLASPSGHKSRNEQPRTVERVLTKLQTYYLVSKREIMKVKIINKRIELIQFEMP